MYTSGCFSSNSKVGTVKTQLMHVTVPLQHLLVNSIAHVWTHRAPFQHERVTDAPNIWWQISISVVTTAIISRLFHNYITHVLYNVCVSGDFYIHMLTHTHMHVHAFTPTEQEGESSTPPWRLKASMSGTLPRFYWVTHPTHSHVLFKFKEHNIRGRHERLMTINALDAITQATHC